MATWTAIGTGDTLPEVLTADEVGEWLHLSSATVRRLAADGTLPGVKIGTKWRFSRERLRAWLAEAAA